MVSETLTYALVNRSQHQDYPRYFFGEVRWVLLKPPKKLRETGLTAQRPFSGQYVVFIPNIVLEQTEKRTLRVHFFEKNPNPDSESKNGFFVSLAKSKKGIMNLMKLYAMKIQWINPNPDS